MLGMTINIFIVLAAATFGSALLDAKLAHANPVATMRAQGSNRHAGARPST
jgi:hypothetical protein